jgi:SPIRAL1-like protein
MQFPSEQQAFRDNRSSNAFANGANQNCGNVLTDRPTTRLHAPPGGKSQMSSILSWEDDTPQTNSRAQREARGPGLPAPAQFGQDPMQQQRGPAPQSFESRRNDYISSANRDSGASSNAYANGANQNCGNVLTDRRTTKVSAPPGGHSSIVFG